MKVKQLQYNTQLLPLYCMYFVNVCGLANIEWKLRLLFYQFQNHSLIKCYELRITNWEAVFDYERDQYNCNVSKKSFECTDWYYQSYYTLMHLLNVWDWTNFIMYKSR